MSSILNRHLLLLTVLSLLAVQIAAQDPSLEPPYTDSLQEFKDKKHVNARTEKLLACWLYFNQHQQVKQLSESAFLHVYKQCMQKISRKQAVLKITELGKRNYEPPTPLDQIIEIGKQTSGHVETEERTDFDNFLLTKSKQFQQQLTEIINKGNITSQIEQQLKRREKYYLGFIPASLFTHTTMIILVTSSVICCCTMWRYYRISDAKYKTRNKGKKGKKGEQDDEEEVMVSAVQRKVNRKKK